MGELRSLPEASLDSAFKTTALSILVLCRCEQDQAAAKQFIGKQLKGKAARYSEIKAGVQQNICFDKKGRKM